VVIAIIAILAALLLPGLNVVRAKAAQGTCSSQMREMVRGIKMFQDDWRVYPDSLYGISYDGSTEQSRLYPDYIKDEKTFNCPYAPFKIRPVPPAGSGISLTSCSDPRYRCYRAPVNRMTGTQTSFWLPDFSSYDFQFRPNFKTPQINELHYMGGPRQSGVFKWTINPASITDDPRQLIYKNPPDNTVVTWCLYHSNMDDAGNPEPKGVALVAFLSGRVQTISADQLANWPAECVTPGTGTNPTNCPWQVSPKP
jgi:type II secretory pathway pseudopilin PulG